MYFYEVYFKQICKSGYFLSENPKFYFIKVKKITEQESGHPINIEYLTNEVGVLVITSKDLESGASYLERTWQFDTNFTKIYV